jgi:hypothetical protein
MTLAHGNFSKVQRAFIGADLFTGWRKISDHTVASAARSVGVSPTLVDWALKRMSQRRAIEQGWLPLVPPLSPAVKAERQVAALVVKLGHARVAELLGTYAPGAVPAAQANDNDTSAVA